MPIDAALARVSELDSLIARLPGGAAPTARSSASTSFQSVLANQAAAVSPSAAPSPPATAAAADGTHYGFVRRSDGVPGDLSFYQHLAANGLGGVVFDSKIGRAHV